MREEYRRRRNAFYDQLDNATRNLVFRRPPSPLARLIENQQTIAIYAAVGSEAPTSNLIEFLFETGKTVAFPRVVGKSPLEFRTMTDVDLLETGFANIPEPGDNTELVTPDVIFAPMTAFDRHMGRLGQGGGHYDRSFQKYPDALRIGLAWSIQETDEVPTEEHDVALHVIVTESELIQIDGLAS